MLFIFVILNVTSVVAKELTLYRKGEYVMFILSGQA